MRSGDLEISVSISNDAGFNFEPASGHIDNCFGFEVDDARHHDVRRNFCR